MEKLIKCKSRNARREMNFTLRYLPKEIEYFVCFCLIGFIKHKNEIFIVFHLKKNKVNELIENIFYSNVIKINCILNHKNYGKLRGKKSEINCSK